MMQPPCIETQRLIEDEQRQQNWQRWGPYLSERQWGTVREDYSPLGDSWGSFPHDHARSRAYRWGEDGLLGITDRECRLCFGLALWNERDPILKERLFGLANGEGNHGEDVKECYFYLDSTPTHSYMKALYKYPQLEFPYAALVDENRRRGKDDPEFELLDTGIFSDHRYFDVLAEYAKASPDDLLIRISITNRGPEPARLHLLPTLWYRNTWSWGRTSNGYWSRPQITLTPEGTLAAEHATLGRFYLAAGAGPDGQGPAFLFTENETNSSRLFGGQNKSPYVKDAFHECVIRTRVELVNPEFFGTKAAAHYSLEIPPGHTVVVPLRLTGNDTLTDCFGANFGHTFDERKAEADEFYVARLPDSLSSDEYAVTRQAYAGLLWSKQFYHYVVKEWLEGDPGSPAPPSSRQNIRNHDWPQLFNRDVISMPDKWEYPWYAAWDLAFHMIPFSRIDPEFAKRQLLLLLREWYMHPSGQLPAYEYNFSDVNPPVHAWACWRVYKMTGALGARDRLFLSRAFHKLLINFTWWVNRKDVQGKHLFAGGFLGLDNIGVFDRSKPLPTRGQLEQADGTAWMAFYCATMLSMALELAREDPAYEDVASKFFEHFIAIADAMNTLGGSGLWDEPDGFYYDQIAVDGHTIPLRLRSMVGIIPLFAVEVLDQKLIEGLPGFSKRMRWFLENRQDLTRHISCMEGREGNMDGRLLLAIPSRERLEQVLRYVLNEQEFLSPHGVRSLSRFHLTSPFSFNVNGDEHRVTYVPGESDSYLFGGNSNWRGPIWFPLNYLLTESLERYHHFYGDSFRLECPTGSGRTMNLREVAQEINARLVSIFLPGESGERPCNLGAPYFCDDPTWRDLVMFHEYFHGDTGKGLGASHQTGWTALVTRCIEKLAHSTPVKP